MIRWTALLALAACTPLDPADRGGGGPRATLERTEEARRSDDASTVEIAVEVDAGVDAFVITAASAEALLGFEALIDPDGETVLWWEDWNGAAESLTNAVYEDRVNSLNWPVRPEDGPLTPGTWTALVTTTDETLSYITDAAVDVTVHRRRDKPANGEVSVRIVYADGLADDAGLVEAVEQGVERWRAIWAEHDLILRETYASSTLDPGLDFAYDGSRAAGDVAAEAEEPGLTLIIGDQFPDGITTFGYSAGLPGPIEPTPLSYVAVSWIPHAGLDARFDDDEAAIFGETMAHECGHYMGLYHPVESDYDGWDALGDTPRCTGEEACERDLVTNNMFPYPLCDLDGCVPQGDLTSDQRGVLQGWTGVR